VIGEASRSVSNQLRERHPDVPWRRIADFRNVAVHQYFASNGRWSGAWRGIGCRFYDLEILKVIEAEFPDVGSRFEEH
jgi:Ribonuclease HepT-like